MSKTLRYDKDYTVHVEANNICLRNESNLPWIERCYIPLDEWKDVKTFVDEQIKNKIIYSVKFWYYDFCLVYSQLNSIVFINEGYQICTETCTIPIAKWEQVKQFIDEQIKTKNNATK